MIKYLLLAAAAGVFMAYMAGVRAGREMCRAQTAQSDVLATTHVIKKMGKIDAETYNHGVGDIRRVLRAKYTIAE